MSLPAILLFGLLASCSSTSSPSSPRSVTQTVGAEGGTIEVDGAVVTFPKGALSEAKAITIESVDEVPEGFVATSKVFRCAPSGTSFAQPVTMTMPFTDDLKGPLTMFWSTGADPSFKEIGGKADGATMSATVLHFSSGFVGRKKP
jgi:hypothetical protein